MDDHSSAAPVARAVKLPTRASGLKRPCGGILPEGRTKPTQGPYSALLRVGLAIPSRLPGPWWALTPPFHHHRESAEASLAGGIPASRQSLLCGAFPEVAPAGGYPAPLLHGVRTFLEGSHPRDHPAIRARPDLRPPPPVVNKVRRVRFSAPKPSTPPAPPIHWPGNTPSTYSPAGRRLSSAPLRPAPARSPPPPLRR